jgi:hypothetical protein
MMSLASVGIVVARRQPGNPLGWMFLALAALSALGVSAGAYAVLSYRFGHHLPLGVAAVFRRPAGGRCCGATSRSARAGR